MTPNERGEWIEKAYYCPIHLVGSHVLQDCNSANDAKSICGIDGCSKHHHKSLHGGTSTFIANVLATESSSFSISEADNVLLSMQTVQSQEGPLNCLFDNAATCSLITECAARRLNLRGEPLKLTITTVTGSTIIDSMLHYVPLLDGNNATRTIKALQVDNISDNVPKVDVSHVQHLFSSQVQKKWDSITDRPAGAIDLLVGADHLGLHPIDFERVANLRILSSSFGSDLILVGSHPSLKSCAVTFSEDASSILHSHHASVNRISVRPIYEFFEAENLGVEPPRRCGSCRNCKDCSFRGHMLSQKEQYETQVIESKIQYDQSLHQFVVSYPFTQDPSILPNNKTQVIKIAEREEKHLAKCGLLDSFNQEFNKMLSNGALVELSNHEQEMWDGPTHYVSLQHVVNESSSTTPLRIVTNSSLSNRNGLSLNSILMKGHDTLSDQWDVLNRW